MKSVPGFGGCYMRDDLPSTLPPNTGFIVNLDVSSGPGTHWTAIMNVPPKTNASPHVCYYDSFGLPPPEELIDKYGRMYYNTSDHQPILSAACGWYCMYILNECLDNKQSFLNAVYSLTPGDGSSDDITHSVGNPDNDEHVIDSVLSATQ